MAVQTVKKEIGDHVYLITPFTAKKGLTILKRVLKLIGPALENMSKEDFDVGTLAAGVISRFDEEPVEQLIYDLIGGVLVDNHEINFNLHFQANYGDLLQLVSEVLKVNYSSVFSLGGFEEINLTQND